jgi:hypothetical protein
MISAISSIAGWANADECYLNSLELAYAFANAEKPRNATLLCRK